MVFLGDTCHSISSEECVPSEGLMNSDKGALNTAATSAGLSRGTNDDGI